MCKIAFRISMFFIFLCAFLIQLDALQSEGKTTLSQVDIDDALMLARYHVGLLPASSVSGGENPGPGMKTLSIEIAGRNIMMFTMDSLYIMPPGKLVSSNSRFSFEPGTQVKLYFVSATPPPIVDPNLAPVQYQTASFLGFQGTNVDIIMDSDKTIRIGYATQVIAFSADVREPQSAPIPSEIAEIKE